MRLARRVPGGGNVTATINGFAAVFSDVDQPNGSGPAKKRGNRNASMLIDTGQASPGNEGRKDE